MVSTGIAPQTLVQSAVDPAMRGRVMGSTACSSAAARPSARCSWAGCPSLFGLRLSVAAGAVLCVAYWAWARLAPDRMDARRSRAERASAPNDAQLSHSAVLLRARLQRRLSGARLPAEGWRIAGTSRDEAHARAWAPQGIAAILRPRPPARRAGSGARRHDAISSAPCRPTPPAIPVLAAHGADIAALAASHWVGYLSRPPASMAIAPAAGSTRAPPIAAERRARPPPRRRRNGLARSQRSHGLPVHVFRLAGIYGPGRSALDHVRAGHAPRRIDKPGQIFSRIHVEDIAAVLEALDGAARIPAPPTMSATTLRRRRRR